MSLTDIPEFCVSCGCILLDEDYDNICRECANEHIHEEEAEDYSHLAKQERRIQLRELLDNE